MTERQRASDAAEAPSALNDAATRVRADRSARQSLTGVLAVPSGGAGDRRAVGPQRLAPPARAGAGWRFGFWVSALGWGGDRYALLTEQAEKRAGRDPWASAVATALLQVAC